MRLLSRDQTKVAPSPSLDALDSSSDFSIFFVVWWRSVGSAVVAWWRVGRGGLRARAYLRVFLEI